MSFKNVNKNSKNDKTKIGEEEKRRELLKTLEAFVKGTDIEEAREMLKKVEADQKLETELKEGDFERIAMLHDLKEQKTQAEIVKLDLNDKIQNLKSSLGTETSKILYPSPKKEIKVSSAMKKWGELHKDDALLSLAGGTLDLNSHVEAVGDFIGEAVKGNSSWDHARSQMFNSILPYLADKGYLGRTINKKGEKNTRYAWLLPKGTKYVKELKNKMKESL